ncbi:hypothetical protein KAFR_0B03890 [Kazachstania africana CBS 2517]|uniref:Bul1 N-terminal domain-containing protein n=1 Tax=Kazachstania africana (strain ATCC 22294 / BCRC 22015 / CBS 2517 / CECT 1963 / NBRC 1671 / NRRL Y-8276) TaxID=1071382 RepID=H2AQN5_KAZAF|nr:hypothetical protein KAFR_0B03890 [Kazachstania africana CBS 2517]CCF56685.1 hypothetical protein KAFR_0B03890 [Kazachstania africana CBS 2517]
MVLNDNTRPSLRASLSDPKPKVRHALPSLSSNFRSSTTSKLPSMHFQEPQDGLSCDAIPHHHSSAGLISLERTIKSPGFDDNDENVVVDVLPSFEMYNTLHRHIPQGNVDPDRHDFPPNYVEVQNQGSSDLRNNESFVEENSTLSDTIINSNNNNTSSGNTTTESLTSVNGAALTALHPLRTQHMSIQNTRTIDEDSLQIQDDINDNDNIVIDKLYSLPKKATPIEISIHLTKHPSLPPHKPEEESILKEYTSGDVIHGYCTVENKSSEPIKFEMFYVTLEGYTSVVDKDKNKRTVKRFLRMVDISASWSYTNIDLGSGFKIVPGKVDFDGSVLGLSNRRILQPGVKYKKFFMFKLPYQLLDVTCKHEHFQHCLLPPSFGIDKYRNGGRYAGIKVNHVLGCGHLGSKGSPILVNDNVDENFSVNYTVDARIVGKDKVTHKLNIMKEQEFYIRVIPFGFHSKLIGERSSKAQLKDFKRIVEDRLEALRKIFERFKNNEPIKNSDIHGTDLSGTITDDIELDSTEILKRKLDQLHIHNRVTSNFSSDFPHNYYEKRNEVDEEIFETELNYKIKSKSLTHKNLLSGFLGGSSAVSNSRSNDQAHSKTSKFGLILLSGKSPENSLLYWSPSLLRKTNLYATKTKNAQENWLRLLQTCPENELQALTRLPLNLTCIQSNNSLEHEPPEIHSITTELICMTAKSDNSIPIKLDPELLMDSKKIASIKNRFGAYIQAIKDYSGKFHDNYEKFNKLYNKNTTRERELKFTDFISLQIYNDIESLADLNVSIKHLPDTFKKQMDTLKDEDSISVVRSNPISASGSALKTKTSGNALTSLSTAVSSSKTPVNSKFVQQIVHEWVKKEPLHYEREINVNLEFNQQLLDTLVPSFQSCLCARLYCIRVHIKFHHIGTTYIDIPVSVKNIKC